MTDLHVLTSTDPSDDFIRRALQDLEHTPGPALGPEIRGRAAARARRRTAAAAVLLLGVSAFLTLRPAPVTLVERGGGTDPAVALSLLVEDDAGNARRLLDGQVGAGHAIIFRVQTRNAGFVCIQEEASTGWSTVLPPQGGSIPVDAGAHLLAIDGQVQAFTTDLGPGQRAYRAQFDPRSADCSTTTADVRAEVRWAD